MLSFESDYIAGAHPVFGRSMTSANQLLGLRQVGQQEKKISKH